MSRSTALFALASLSLGACAADEITRPQSSSSTPTARTTVVPSTSAARSVERLMGPLRTSTEISALGTVFSRYETDFRTKAEARWAADGANWALADNYDRAMIYYVWWARTGNSTYLSRANQLAVNYRDGYVINTTKYRPAPYQYQGAGIALHYLATGDQRSRTTVGVVADGYAAWYPMYALGDKQSASMDARGQARALTTFLHAWEINAPSGAMPSIAAGGHNWASVLRTALTRILSTQSSDGAFRYRYTCNYSKPWMTGILLDALLQYYQVFEADSRIPTAVQRAVDYLWVHDWNATAQQFWYIEGYCSTTGERRVLAGDLNNLLSSAFAFTYAKTKNSTYRARADQIFASGVVHAYLDGSKQFNQEYHSSYRYLGLRTGTVMTPIAPAP